MISRARPTTTFPASLILAPRELKQYRRFQAQTTTLPPKSQGFLPTAEEYADFQSWLAKRDSGYLSDTPLADISYYAERANQHKEEEGKASTCGHALHPTHKEKTKRCPVCTVDVHVTYMKALTVALEDAGGMLKQRWEAVDHDCPALQAWYAGKLAFVKEIDKLENLAQHEQDGDEHQHNSGPTRFTTEVKTATQALSSYWDSLEANPKTVRLARRKTTCNVVFGPETSFDPGRSQHYFWRKSLRYEAGGKYSSPRDDGGEEVDDEDCEGVANTEKRLVITATEAVATRQQDLGEEEQLEEDEEDEEDDDEDDDEEDEEDDEEEDEDEDEEVDADYIVFETEEIVVDGAEFIVFED